MQDLHQDLTMRKALAHFLTMCPLAMKAKMNFYQMMMMVLRQ
jgi:hypothetical protein